MAMGTSNSVPSFLMSAGASRIVTFWFFCFGERKPLFLIAADILSFSSSTALSGSQKMKNGLRRRERSTSTRTRLGLRKWIWAEETAAKDIGLNYEI